MPVAALRRAYRRLRYGRPIVVVSGLPRSGTSMMMQMLEAGGVDPLTDGIRSADESNPLGYYELEPVKKLEDTTDPRWLDRAHGRAVKVIAFLLPHLPETFNYKVVFMQRRLDEILESQTRMLDRLGEADDADDERLKHFFVDHLARSKSLLAYRPWFDALHVRYHDVLADPRGEAERVSRFLGRRMDTKAMAEVVDPDLYRSRA